MQDDVLKHWERIEPILDRALELRADARRAYLDEACGADPDLRERVERLLAADEGASVLDRPAELTLAEATAASEGAFEGSDGLAAGERIGPFAIESEIGRGGMGTVYLARRVDGAYEQQVAIKMLDRRVRGRRAHERFQNERQFLARLAHPHIARLLDGGVTEDGRPYFAMEYVEGQTLTRHCESLKLSLPERLRLFDQVCIAVGFAHAQLIVHRDLKPGNVLVDREGQVKLLDFGIAKSLEPSGDVSQTQDGERVLTPLYSAPEQFLSEPVTTATDVYALGLVLYELLTGSRAHQLEGRSPIEIQRVVLEQDPMAPSRALQAKTADDTTPTTTVSDEAGARPILSRSALSTRLKGDLDSIVLKALRREPEERYPSVDALRADLAAYAEQRPVSAHKGALSYRMKKMIRRNRLPILAAAIVFLSLSTGVVVAARQAREAAAQRDIAQQANSRESAIKEFLLEELFMAPSPERTHGKEMTLSELMAQASRSLDHAFPDHPGIEASIRATLARTYMSLGDFEKAGEMIQKAEAEWVGSAVPRERLQLRALDAELDALEGRFDEAAEALEAILAEQLSRRGTEDLDVLQTQYLLGWVDNLRNQPEESERRLRNVIEVASAPDLADSAWRVRLQASSVLVATLYDRYKLVEASELAQATHEEQQRRLGPDHPDTIYSLKRLTDVLRRQLRYDEALELQKQVYDQQRELLGEDHPATLESLHGMGVIYDRLNEYSSAIATIEKAYLRRAAVLGSEHPDTLISLRSLGLLHRLSGELARAEPIYRQVLAQRRAQFGETHPQVLTAVGGLQNLMVEMERWPEASALAVELCELYERAVIEGQLSYTALRGYADFLMDVLPEQHRQPERALQIAELAVKASRRGRIYPLYSLADAYIANGDDERAIEILYEAREIDEWTGSWTGERRLVNLLRKYQRYEEANQVVDRLLATRQAVRPAQDPLIAYSYWRRAQIAEDRQDLSLASDAYRQALEQFESGAGPADWRAGWMASSLGHSLFLRGLYREAASPLQQGFETLIADPRVRQHYVDDARTWLVANARAQGNETQAQRWRDYPDPQSYRLKIRRK